MSSTGHAPLYVGWLQNYALSNNTKVYQREFLKVFRSWDMTGWHKYSQWVKTGKLSNDGCFFNPYFGTMKNLSSQSYCTSEAEVKYFLSFLWKLDLLYSGYYFDDHNYYTVIFSSFRLLESVTFCLRTNMGIKNTPFQLFKPIFRCSSLIGRNQNGNQQSISIGSECSSRAIILHEMYHVMGFYHEMRRFDRNKNIEVFWENILPGIV